jgi:hypothetical protein
MRKGSERRSLGGLGCPVERVVVEPSHQHAGVQPLGGLDERTEEILPPEKAVGEIVQLGLPLNVEERPSILLEHGVDGGRCGSPSLDVSRRLDERFRPGVDAVLVCGDGQAHGMRDVTEG